VSDDYHLTGEHAQSDRPFLSIVKTIIVEGERRAIEDNLRVGEVKAALADVDLVLSFVPFEAHGAILKRNFGFLP
jgi:hypothetical protein